MEKPENKGRERSSRPLFSVSFRELHKYYHYKIMMIPPNVCAMIVQYIVLVFLAMKLK